MSRLGYAVAMVLTVMLYLVGGLLYNILRSFKLEK